MKSEDLRRRVMNVKKKKKIYNFGAIAHEVIILFKKYRYKTGFFRYVKIIFTN